MDMHACIASPDRTTLLKYECNGNTIWSVCLHVYIQPGVGVKMSVTEALQDATDALQDVTIALSLCWSSTPSVCWQPSLLKKDAVVTL